MRRPQVLGSEHSDDDTLTGDHMERLITCSSEEEAGVSRRLGGCWGPLRGTGGRCGVLGVLGGRCCSR